METYRGLAANAGYAVRVPESPIDPGRSACRSGGPQTRRQGTAPPKTLRSGRRERFTLGLTIALTLAATSACDDTRTHVSIGGNIMFQDPLGVVCGINGVTVQLTHDESGTTQQTVTRFNSSATFHHGYWLVAGWPVGSTTLVVTGASGATLATNQFTVSSESGGPLGWLETWIPTQTGVDDGIICL